MNISYLKYHPTVIYRAILRKVVRKSTRDNPERYCRWFWVHCSSKTFERMAREAYRRMFASAKGKWQKLFRQLQCQKQWIDRIPYYLSGLSRAHFFRQPFSKKLHIQGGKTIEHKSPIRLNHNLIFFATFRGLDHVCQKLLCRVQETEKFTFI